MKLRPRSSRAIRLALGSALWLAVGLVATPAAAALDREQAVAAARQGRLDEAIAALQALDAAGDIQARHDLVAVYGWAGRRAEAIAAFERILPPGSAPAYVQRDAAAAYRGERRYAEAEALARALLKAQPDDAEAARLLSGVLTDSGRAREAVALMQQQLQRQPKEVDHWIALGNAAREVPDPFTALRAYGQARALQPANREAAESISGVLRELGAPFGTAQQLQDVPLALRVAQAGRQVRWATQIDPPGPGAARFITVDAALAEIERLLAEVAATPGADPALRTSLRFDQLTALHQRERWQAVLDAAAGLRADGIALPLYLRRDEAGALLALRRPAEALTAYDEVLAAEPADHEAIVGRFFALVELEDFAGAMAMMDALLAREPQFKRFGVDPTPLPNPDWLDWSILAAKVRSYAGMQAEAWERLQPLVAGAPALSWLREANASVAAERGWLRLADEEIRIAASLAPDSRGIAINVADSDMRLKRWPEARERVAVLAEAYPDYTGVRRSVRDLAVHDLYELDAGTTLRHENGAAAAAPGSGVEGHVRLYSPPIAELWRIAAAAERQTAEPIEGKVVRLLYGLGTQYRGADVDGQLMAWSNQGTLSKGGASLNGAWHGNDHVWIGAGVERFSRDMPLRPLLYGITADSANLSASYSWSESRSVSAGFQGMKFSDGNRREAWSLGWMERLVTQPHLKIDARPSFYTSSNSSQAGPYFAPIRDRVASLSLEADHVIWRWYERSFTHNLSVSAGNYWQQGFGSGAVGSLRYQQVWRHDPLTEWRYGISFGRAIYDGVPENSGALFVNLIHRF